MSYALSFLIRTGLGKAWTEHGLDLDISLCDETGLHFVHAAKASSRRSLCSPSLRSRYTARKQERQESKKKGIMMPDIRIYWPGRRLL